MMERLLPGAVLAVGAIAESLPAPDHYSSVGWLAMTGAGLMLMVKLALDLWKDHFREQPRPAETYVTQSRCGLEMGALQAADQAMETDLRRLGEKMDQVRDAVQSEASRRANIIHARVDELGRELGAVAERATLTNQRLAQVDQKMDRLLERTK